MLKEPILPSFIFKTHPFLNLLSKSKFLCLILDRHGRVVFACNRQNHPRQVLINRMMGGKIGDFFKVQGGRDLNRLLARLPAGIADLGKLTWDSMDRLGWDSPFFPSTPLLDRHVAPPGIHTRISQCNMNLFRVDDRSFLCVVSFYEFDPLISGRTSDLVLVTDLEGRLLAYNQGLCEALRLEDPHSLLTESLEKVAAFEVGGEKGTAGPAAFREVPVARRWKIRPSEALQYFHFPDAVDHDGCDYRVEFSARAISGQNALPCLLLRAERQDPADAFGYLFGPHAGGRHLVFKKKGIELKKIPCPGLEKMAEVRLSAEKIGQGFKFFLNREIVHSFQERFPFPASKGTHPALMARAGTACEVSGISATVSQAVAPAEAPVFASLRGKPGDRFRVRQDPGSFHSTGPVLIYRFENITSFDREIARLSREKEAVASEKRQVERALESQLTLGTFVGENSRIQAIRENIGVLAASATCVLLTGETGTGKEELARLFHRLSPRAEMPFVKLDCSTLPATLIEGELFGYEAGAFTGAVRAHAGKFEQANGGTLFLDEIGNLSLDTQAKLLGVLEDFAITRLGGNRPVPLSLSVISATNRSLEELIGKNLFRADLYYRLSRFKVAVPPLRDRPDDLPLLCRYFLEEANREFGKAIETVSEAAYKRIFTHAWPGNVRELKNVLSKAVLFCKTRMLEPEDLDIAQSHGARKAAAPSGGPREKIKITEPLLRKALSDGRGRISAAAAEFGVTRPTIYNYLRRWNIPLTEIRARKKDVLTQN